MELSLSSLLPPQRWAIATSISDILDWRPYLGYCTGVERKRSEKKQRDEDLEIQRLIHKNVLLNGIDEFQLLLGDIEDIIANGVDQNRQRPRMSAGDNSLLSSFCYDLVNLDFLGGMGYKAEKTRKVRRTQALQKFLERQSGKDFLLLLTLNVRDNIDDELIRYLEGAQHEVESEELRKTLHWYATCKEGMKEYRLKATVPLFIQREGEVCGFDCFCYPPLAYTGSGSARMVHFVFELTDTQTILHAHSRQRISEVVNLPLLSIEKDGVYLPPKQHPHFDAPRADLLDLFTEQTQRALQRAREKTVRRSQ